jgi:uncharacterized membrane protein
MRAYNFAERSLAGDLHGVNVGAPERWLSTVAGGSLLFYGLSRGSLRGLALAVAGGGLVYRGATGHCDVYEALDINRADRRRDTRRVLAGKRGINVQRSVTINRPPEEVYAFWRDLENLPRFMKHLCAVRHLGGRRSHWVAAAPGGTEVHWDAEIINEIENKVIGWRSLPGADVASAGSVHVDPEPAGRGTRLTVTLQYSPPGGRIGAVVARTFGEEPSQQIAEDLARLKQLLETGEIPTTDGQPSGRG